MIQATKRKVTLSCLFRWDLSPPTSCFNPLLLFPLFDCQPVILFWLQEIRCPETLLKVFRAKLLSGQGCCDHLTSIFLAKLERGTLTLFSSGSDRKKSPGILTQSWLCVRWLIANKLLLPGSWLERETHSLKLFKDIKKLIEVVPFPESQGLHPAWLWPSLPAFLSLFWTLLPWPCGNLLLLPWCWQMHLKSPTSVLQWGPSPSPLCEPEVFAGTAGSHRVTQWHQSQELSLLSCWRQGF